MEIESICHRRLGGLLPRWIARALPRLDDDRSGRGRSVERRLPDHAATSFSIAAGVRSTHAGRRNRFEDAPLPQQQPSAAPRPLRVLQIIDDTSAAAGRIVISGRMADVCAELERLAALESRRSCA